MKTLKERLAWILENRTETADGKPMTLNALGVTAGLTRNHVSSFMTDPTRSKLRPPTLTRLAWAAGVSYRWLSGEGGSPNAKDVPSAPTLRAPRGALEPCSTVRGWTDAALTVIQKHPTLAPYVFEASSMMFPPEWRTDAPVTPLIVQTFARMCQYAEKMRGYSEQMREQREQLDERMAATLPFLPVKPRQLSGPKRPASK